MQSETDVIIIGAGAAGLSAAKELARLGLTYTVIEGSHRIGGRAYSEEIGPDEWFDLGCAYLVDGEANPFTAIADKLGITLDRDKSDLLEDKNIRFQRNGIDLNADQRSARAQFYSDSYRAIHNAAKKGQDVPLSDIIDLDNEFAVPLLSDIAITWGKDVDLVSTIELAGPDAEFGFPALRGYGNLVATWGENVAVSLNTRAERIDWSGQGDYGVTVETPKGTLRGRTILCTVSTGILASGNIHFNPGLPDWKTEAIHNLPMGTENKMGVYFDADVFGSEGRGRYSIWDDNGNAAKVEASVMGLNIASVFTGGRHAEWLERQGQQAGHDFAVDRIADIFGNDIRKHVSRTIVTAWNTEPWTLGSWACAIPGQAHHRANLQRPVDEHLFFAGEATYTDALGTCHGAYHSGIRAAKEIAAQLNVGT